MRLRGRVDPGLVAFGAGALAAIVGLVWAIWRVSHRARELHGREMGLLEHLRELRFRVLASLAAIGAFAVFLFSFGLEPVTVYGLPLYVPFPSVAEAIGTRGLRLVLDHALPDFVDVVVIQPSEAIMAQFQASLIGALLLASPIVAYQVAAFVAPALHPDERRTIAVLAPLALVLYLAGMAFAIFVMIPVTLTTLYQYAAPLGADPLAQPQNILTFVLFTTLLFGVAFETPLVMAGLSYAGIVHPRKMARHWRGVVVGVLILGALTTDPNPVTQLLVGVPLVVLYFAGLGAAKLAWRDRPPRSRPEETTSFS